MLWQYCASHANKAHLNLREREIPLAGIVGEGVNNQRSLLLQYHDWGVLEQGTEPPTAPRVL